MLQDRCLYLHRAFGFSIDIHHPKHHFQQQVQFDPYYQDLHNFSMDWSMVIAIMSLFSSFLSANKQILDGIVHISKDPCICVIQYVYSLTNRTTGEVQQFSIDANMFDSRFSFHRFNSPLALLISLMMLLSQELIVTSAQNIELCSLGLFTSLSVGCALESLAFRWICVCLSLSYTHWAKLGTVSLFVLNLFCLTYLTYSRHLNVCVLRYKGRLHSLCYCVLVEDYYLFVVFFCLLCNAALCMEELSERPSRDLRGTRRPRSPLADGRRLLVF